ncbi:MAG: hypothetical protein HKN01_02430, partial [Acidimicrobiia bacterium]|nr:hypothetical protein [Acidimicrobiia bacterium]
MSTTTIWRRALVAVAVLAVALAVIPAASAEEDPAVLDRVYPLGTGFQLFDSATQMTDVIETTASIGGGSGVAPRIFCKWELPDMVPGTPNTPFQEYSDDPTPSPVAVHLAGLDQLNPWDDDDLVPDPFEPCSLTAADGFPEYADGAIGSIQVRANAEDLPEERVIELWAAVGPLSVDDVYWKVFHPDGSIKVQVHGTPVECLSELGATAGDSLLAPGSMFWAANGTGQLS